MNRRSLHSPRRFAIAAGLCTGLLATAASADEQPLHAAALADAWIGTAAGVAIADDGNTLVATVDEGRGRIVRIDADGEPIDGVAFDGAIVGFDATADRTAVLLEGELVVLAPGGSDPWAVQWRAPLAAGSHVAIGEHGTVAVVASGELRSFGRDGEVLGRAALAMPDVAALAVLDADDRIVVGGSQRTRACGQTVIDAALVAFDRSGEQRWDAYADAGLARPCDRSLADTTIVDVTRGDDGALYVLAEVEGPGAARLFDGGALVAFDAHSRATTASEHVAYYARLSGAGGIRAAQYLGFDDVFASVRPHAIAADAAGNVHITGASTHTIEPDGNVAEAMGERAAFHQVIAADLGSRMLWQTLDLADLEASAPDARIGLAVHAGRAIAIVPSARRHDGIDVQGPSVLVLPTEPKEVKGKRPDRDDVGTFGYESGISGADPSCYCDARRRDSPTAWLAGFTVVMLARRRRRHSQRP